MSIAFLYQCVESNNRERSIWSPVYLASRTRDRQLAGGDYEQCKLN